MARIKPTVKYRGPKKMMATMRVIPKVQKATKFLYTSVVLADGRTARRRRMNPAYKYAASAATAAPKKYCGIPGILKYWQYCSRKHHTDGVL